MDADYGQMLGPKEGSTKPWELTETKGIRVNPLWYRLEDFPRQLLLERKGALWHYSVGGNGEISIGSEEIRGVVQDDEWEQLHAGMQTKDSSLTMEDLKGQLDRQGHPTIAAGFSSSGRSAIRPARVSGEVQWKNERFEVNDKSGRYMSKKVRADSTADESMRWLENVARRMSAQWGVEVHPVIVKS
jgi:hypothetical protein